MDAVHLMRALTGRDLIIKVEGCYHGHHDSVQVSVLPEADEVGPRRRARHRCPATPASRRRSWTWSSWCRSTTSARWPGRSPSTAGQIAGMILEPVMMNAGIIPPDDGYLAGLRDLLHADGALLIFDEVKTGFTTGPGGRHRHATASCPTSSAWPRRSAAASRRGDRRHRGGDVGDRRRPLRAGRHVQRQPAGDGGRPRERSPTSSRRRRTPTSTQLAARAAQRLRSGDRRSTVCRWHVVTVGAKGCVAFRRRPGPRTSATSSQIDDRLGHLHWLMQHNGGVFLPPWGKVEQWLLSVQHTDADVDRFVANFARLAAVTPGPPMGGGARRLRLLS